MSRYIDADNIRKPIYAEEDNCTGVGMTFDEMDAYNNGIDAMIKQINSVPIADVEKVVRCKNCIYYQAYQKPVEDFDGRCIVRECETDEVEFCSYGKDKG